MYCYGEFLENSCKNNPDFFIQHFSLNSRPAKLKKFAKLKDFRLNSTIFMPKLNVSENNG